jgi:hypothetical protein
MITLKSIIIGKLISSILVVLCILYSICSPLIVKSNNPILITILIFTNLIVYSYALTISTKTIINIIKTEQTKKVINNDNVKVFKGRKIY